MLDSRQLAAAQAYTQGLMDQAISVQHVTTAPGAYREAVPTLGTAFTVPALIGKPSDETLKVYANKIGEHFAWTLGVATGTNLLPGDQVTLPNGVVCTVIGPDLVKSYPFYNNFVAIAVR